MVKIRDSCKSKSPFIYICCGLLFKLDLREQGHTKNKKPTLQYKKMKKTILILTLLACTLIKVSAQEWLTDINEAKKSAAERNNNIILVFQGSDWCAPCMKLEQEIWSTEVFKKYAEGHYIMLKADFPKKKANQLSDEQQEKNNLLAEKYNRQGYFPFVVVLNKDGKVLGTTGYKNVSPFEYIEILNALSETHG